MCVCGFMGVCVGGCVCGGVGLCVWVCGCVSVYGCGCVWVCVCVRVGVDYFCERMAGGVREGLIFPGVHSRQSWQFRAIPHMLISANIRTRMHTAYS